MSYPKTLSEDETLDAAICGVSLSRFGDGELKLALGKNCVSQIADKSLAIELKEILARGTIGCLVCIPNLLAPTKKAWSGYTDPKFTSMYGKQVFGSAFITRPDSAPWIDRPDYWAKLQKLWTAQDVTLVKGSERSLREETLATAATINVVEGPRRDAYAVIDELEEKIGRPHGPIIMCLGPAATVLAWRLAKKGLHAIDLGHVGMFMRHAGAYAHKIEDLISWQYRRQLELLREERGWGGDGWKHAGAVIDIIRAEKPTTILDYGSGEGRLRKEIEEALPGTRVQEYDPGVKGKGGLPKPCDLVVSTDVLEHIESDKIDSVLDHLFRIAGKNIYLVIATRPANAKLPDGRNAHLIVRPSAWWLDKINRFDDWGIGRVEETEGREVRVWLRKK